MCEWLFIIMIKLMKLCKKEIHAKDETHKFKTLLDENLNCIHTNCHCILYVCVCDYAFRFFTKSYKKKKEHLLSTPNKFNDET